jgi:hypothetical protein
VPDGSRDFYDERTGLRVFEVRSVQSLIQLMGYAKYKLDKEAHLRERFLRALLIAKTARTDGGCTPEPRLAVVFGFEPLKSLGPGEPKALQPVNLAGAALLAGDGCAKKILGEGERGGFFGGRRGDRPTERGWFTRNSEGERGGWFAQRGGWGFGGVPPSIQAPGLFDGCHQNEADPERVEGWRAVEVDDQEKVNVIGHDHEVRESRGWVDAMKREQNVAQGLARRQKGGARLRVDEPRKSLNAVFERERDEEELATRVAEIQFHGDSIPNFRGDLQVA